MKSLVVNWLMAGAPFSSGARLFSLLAGKRHPFNILLRKENKTIHRALKLALCKKAGIPVDGRPAEKPAVTKPATAAPPVPPPPKRKLREDWPFLSDPACPPELKILAANKITAWQYYTAAHEHLFDCTTAEEQFATVRCLVENYIENRKIVREFLYYKEHGTPLGNHPAFQEYKEIHALRKLNIVDLLKMKNRLQDNIWRIQSEIKKGDRKHLQTEREQRLQQKKNLLAEVDRLIAEYNK